MPASLALQEEYESELQVLFVESQGADLDRAEAFAWRKEWMGTHAMWTDEPPLRVEGRTLPKFALLGVDGRLLLSGNPLSMKKEIEERIAAEVKRARSVPEGTPAKLAKAWSTFVKGEVGAALAECDRVAAASATLADAARSLRLEMVARTGARVERGKWLIDNGYIDVASELLAALGESIEGCRDFDQPFLEQSQRLTTPDAGLKSEIEASLALASLQKKMQKDEPFDDANVKSLAKLADKYRGTKAGERAARLVKLSKIEF